MSSYYDRKKKENGIKFRISFVILFAAASFAACFALYMKSSSPADDKPQADGSASQVTAFTVSQTVSETETETETEAVSERTSTADINPIAESAEVDESYFDDCMFVGDSLMVGLGTYGFISEEQIAAGIGMSVVSIGTTPLTNADGSEILAADKVNAASPRHVYILLGLNMLGTYTDEQLLSYYGDFIDSINRENTDIYVISVPPVTGERETDEDNPILNSDIDSFNADLLKFVFTMLTLTRHSKVPTEDFPRRTPRRTVCISRSLPTGLCLNIFVHTFTAENKKNMKRSVTAGLSER